MGPFVSQRLLAPEMAPNQADLIALTDFIESDKLTPMIDRTYPLAETREAIRYLHSEGPNGSARQPLHGFGSFRIVVDRVMAEQRGERRMVTQRPISRLESSPERAARTSRLANRVRGALGRILRP
jgi:Zinc-binding dehydrogenase